MILFSEIVGNDLTQSQLTTTVIPPDEEETEERAEIMLRILRERIRK
jgi:hypothetical protein